LNRTSKKRGLFLLSLALLAALFLMPLRFTGASSGTAENPVKVTTTGCPTAQNCSFGNYPTESSFQLPFSQQKIFQNPRPNSHQDFYMFYSTNMSISGSGCTSNGVITNLCYECVYANSADGVTWRVNQTIGSGLAGVGNFYINCSAAYFDDTAHNQLVVYVVAARNAASVNTNHNIELVIGTVSDSADAITWGQVQTVSKSSPTQNFQFPVVQMDPNGYLQIAYSWVDSSTNRQTVDLCSSTVAHPTTNSSWTCNGGNNDLLFKAQAQVGQTAGSFMPQLQPVPGHSVLVLQGSCDNIATSACSQAASLTESATLVDWDGTTQKFSSAASFTYPAQSSSDRRSSTMDPATGTIYVAYPNGTDGKFWVRFMVSPYTAWSTPTRITSDSGEGRIVLLTGTGTGDKLVFIDATDLPKTVSGGGGSGTCGSCPSINMYMNTTNNGRAWSGAMTLYANTTWAATWANVPWRVDTSTSSKLPIMWEQHVCGYATTVPCTSQPEELWFNPHTLYTPTSSQLKASFTYTPTTPTIGQTITYTATVSGGTSPYNYGWNFGDGTSGAGASTTHAYTATGSFTVTLTVKDSGSQQQVATSQQTIAVANQTKPTPVAADFTFSPASPDAGQSVSFTGSSSGGTAPYRYSWSFSDGGNASARSVTHTFTSGGNYSVSLTVTDSLGNNARATKILTVNPQVSGSFSYSPSSPLPLLPVEFAASGTGGSLPYSYSWNFGDGGTGSGQTVSHSYLLPGSYVVTLSITDANGQTFATSQTIVVLTNLGLGINL
jgi:PKD repeat protein